MFGLVKKESIRTALADFLDDRRELPDWLHDTYSGGRLREARNRLRSDMERENARQPEIDAKVIWPGAYKGTIDDDWRSRPVAFKKCGYVGGVQVHPLQRWYLLNHGEVKNFGVLLFGRYVKRIIQQEGEDGPILEVDPWELVELDN